LKISNRFTKFGHNDYLKFKSEHRIVPDGVNAKVMWSCSTMQYTVVETVWHINSIMLRMFLLVNLHLGECIQLCFGIKFASSIGTFCWLLLAYVIVLLTCKFCFVILQLFGCHGPLANHQSGRAFLSSVTA